MINISTESVLAGLGALIACITFLFKLLQSSYEARLRDKDQSCESRLQEKNETILWLKSELRTSLITTERATTAAETATAVTKKATTP